MKHYFTTLVVSFATLLPSTRAFAQMDVDELMYDNSFEKITRLYGQPLERVEEEGEGGFYMWLTYPEFHTVLDKETGNIFAISFWANDICVLSSYVQSGIKVGDRASAYKDVDFSKLVTGKHYESLGLAPLKTPYVNSCDNYFNYGILSRGKPYRIDFAVENDIIKAILVRYLDDDTEPANYVDEQNVADESHQVML